jgi:Zn-dependent metalloprotease
MKKNVAFIIVLLFVFVQIINAQSNKILKIEYSKDSIPSLLDFNTSTTKYRHTDGINVIKEYLKLSKDDSFKSIKSFTDNLGFFHERFQHYYSGLKVEFSEYNVHSNKGQITSISGTLKRIKSINIKPTLTENEALSFALRNIKAESYMWENSEMEELLRKERNDSSATYYPKGDLVIWTDWNSDRVVLTYKFTIFSQIPFDHNYVYIDANNGNVINIQSLFKGVIGGAVTKYCGLQYIETYDNDATYELYDATRNIKTLDSHKCTNFGTAHIFQDMDNYWSYEEFHNETMDDAALSAHFAAEKTYDYFNQSFIGRQGWDGDNSLLTLYVHFDINWSNSRWDPDSDVIEMGDGDGGINYDPWADLDATAHEYAHGIKDDEIGQNYDGEPGTIEEGLSDIWAACVENYASLANHDIWMMFEGFEKTGVHRRNMANPNSNPYHYHLNPYQDPCHYPDVYHGQYWYTGSGDNHGVHYNSTVFSHWFYLLSQGGSGTNSEQVCYNVIPIGMTDAAKIVYYMETVYLTTNSTFPNARTFSIASANILFGQNSNQVAQVTNAWHAVGVGDAYQDQITGPTLTCASETITFSVKYLPQNCSVSWSCGPFLERTSPQGSNPCSFSTSGNGSSWVSATINYNCGSQVLQKTIWSGPPIIDQIEGPLVWCPSCYELNYAPYVAWVRGNPTGYGWYTNDNEAAAFQDDWGSVHIGLWWPNAYYSCYIMSGQWTLYFTTYNDCDLAEAYITYEIPEWCASDGYSMSISPNPASDYVEVSITSTETQISSSTKNAEETRYTVRIVNSMGIPVYSSKKFEKTFTIAVNNLQDGIYSVEINNGKKSITKELIIKHQ